MSISVDPKKMEKLASLEQALEFVQDPEQYLRIVAEVKHAVDAYNKATEKFASVEAADRYLGEARKMLEVSKAETVLIQEMIKQKQVEFETLVASRTRELDARAGSIAQMEARVKERKAVLDTDVGTYEYQKKEFQVMSEKQLAILAKREESLARRERDIAEKMTALAGIING